MGEATESVTVSADASLLQTESSQLVHNVTLSQLDNLPLLSVGATNEGIRDYFSSSRLLPGIQYSNSGSSSAVVSAVVNGTPTNTLQTRLDGATMNRADWTKLLQLERQRSAIDAVLAALRGVENSSAKGVPAEAALGRAEWCFRMSSGTREVYFARP